MSSVAAAAAAVCLSAKSLSNLGVPAAPESSSTVPARFQPPRGPPWGLPAAAWGPARRAADPSIRKVASLPFSRAVYSAVAVATLAYCTAGIIHQAVHRVLQQHGSPADQRIEIRPHKKRPLHLGKGDGPRHGARARAERTAKERNGSVEEERTIQTIMGERRVIADPPGLEPRPNRGRAPAAARERVRCAAVPRPCLTSGFARPAPRQGPCGAHCGKRAANQNAPVTFHLSPGHHEAGLRTWSSRAAPAGPRSPRGGAFGADSGAIGRKSPATAVAPPRTRCGCCAKRINSHRPREIFEVLSSSSLPLSRNPGIFQSTPRAATTGTAA